ncbi:ATP-binding protein [Methyloversatilis sp.]|uniref:ATP-binding protein n=1 Tax=Methyloversatilis sp. TaxID=2569862 RepID=UPI003F6E92DB
MKTVVTTAGGPEEQRRLQLLDELAVLDTPPDPVLDGLVRCASSLLGYPIALVSLVDEHRQWFKARHGLAAAGTPREVAFCAHAILGNSLFEVPDATTDPRFAANPLVTGEPHVRAYAGMPLTVAGQNIGMLCLIDHQPRQLEPGQAALLADLAHAVSHWFESRREHLELQAERARSAERLALLENLAEQAPGMLFQYRVDAQGAARFSYVSPQVRELFALEPDAVRDDVRPFLQRAHPDDREGLRAALAAAAARTVPWRHEFRIELADGGLAWRSARATPVSQGDGTILWHGFIADITEQVEVEQLRRGKQAAEQASREKSAFLSRVSHELRTPLNAMLGFTQLLQIDTDEPLSPRQQERVGHAHRAAQLLLGLINDVLDVSRIEQGARQLALQPLAVHELVSGCLPMVAQMAAQAGVLLAFSAADDGPALVAEGDPRAVEQVLLNLLSNGVKYNRRGGTLAVALCADPGWIWIEVRDEGPGLDAAQCARLFQPFERLGAEHTQVEGSGLGLVISRQLVEAMGGEITVASVPGQGSQFTVRLRRVDALPPATVAVGTPRTTTVESPVDRDEDGVTVLYIEDDPINALLVQEALHSRPHWRLFHAADGRSGLALAQALQPTIVLTDINLPGLSGQAVVQALRRDPAIRRTVCIALSADAMDEQIVDAMHAGFDDYWTKPLDVRALPQRIEAWLDRGESRLVELGALET